MKHINFKPARYIFILIFLFAFQTAFSQELHLPEWEHNISLKLNLSETQRGIESLKQQAIQTKNDVLYARTLRDLMLICDQRTEDTLYFRNSAFMDTLLHQPASTKLKAMLHIMQAQRLLGFKQRYHRFNAGAYRTPNLQYNYAALDAKGLDSAASYHITEALKYHDTNASRELLWLSSSQDVFLFDPRLEDIAITEQINFRNVENWGVAHDAKWLSLSSEAFVNKLDSVYKVNKNAELAFYDQWMLMHKGDENVQLFIQSLARKSIFLPMSNDAATRKIYMKYLEESTQSAHSLLKANAIYQLCLLWNEDGNKYYSWGNRYYNAGISFQPQYQFYCEKALNLYLQHKDLLSNYIQLNEVLASMQKQISAVKLRVEMNNRHLPNRDIPFRVLYRNTDVLSYRIVRVTAAEAALNAATDFTQQMLKRPAEREEKLKLPLPADHNKHAVYLKLAGLPVGHYRLMVSPSDFKYSIGSNIYTLPFEVTGIAAVNNGEHVFVLNRQTGKPLQGAEATLFSKKTNAALSAPVKVGSSGYTKIKNFSADSLRIIYKGDTTGTNFAANDKKLNNNETYDKDEFDDMLDFYDDKLRVEVFTDRAIYRPGQTVHYKVIFLTNNPKTGVPMLFTPANMGWRGKHLLKKWLDDANDEITLLDPFNKKIDSATISINNYGSFAGSFIIPKTAATGRWSLGGLPSTGNNDGDFKVEEYKRPSIELTMDKQKKKLQPGEPFNIKLKLRSFSGADLNNVPIKYTLTRTGSVPGSKSSGTESLYTNVQLIVTKSYTDEKGELLIAVKDLLLAKMQLPDSTSWNYNYLIDATAVDASGESVDLQESVNVSSWPVKISMPVQHFYDRQKPVVLKLGTTDDFEGVSKHKVRLRFYRVNDPATNLVRREVVDQWVYPVADWNKWFPAEAVLAAPKPMHLEVLDTTISVNGYENFTVPKTRIKAGFYEVLATVTENDRIVGHLKNNFNVFDTETGESPVANLDYLPFNSSKAGETVTWQNSNANDNYIIYGVTYVKSGKKPMQHVVFQLVTEKAGISTWQYKVPADAVGQIVLSRLWVYNGQAFNNEKTIYLPEEIKPSPEIIVERYRKVMAPGTKETFSVAVKTKNDNVAAELMTTLYDATLDKLYKTDWRLPSTGRRRSIYLNTDWITSQSQKHTIGSENETDYFNVRPTREISSLGSIDERALNGKVAGISITNASGLNEVVVVGYGTVQKRSYSTGSVVVTIRGTSSLSEYNQPLIIIDGEVYTGDIKNIKSDTITQAMVLKGADASAIYGSRAANGVLVISTKGPIVFPEEPKPEVKVRKDFNETAFFFPQVHASTDGFYTFSFTMPESATEWNWKMLAHTRDARFAYLERKLQTQLSLMVQPNMPRLLYQGDKIKLQSRISNLDTLAVSGKATCKIEDAVTGEDITAKLLGNNSQEFNLAAKSTGSVAFMLQVPADQLNPLKIVVSAVAGSIADAEEHLVPVLSPKVFVRQSQRVEFAAQPLLSITPVKLPADASLFGMSLSVNPKPQAALINALPWLANYSYDCAEQTFNKLRAQVAALRLMQRDSLAQLSFKNAVGAINQQKTKTEQLPDEMAEAAMPWLNISNRVADRQQQLFKLLDTSVTKTNIYAKLARLYKLQQTDGGLSWFDGGQSSAYISSYVLAGFGQLAQLGWKPDLQKTREQNEFLKKLVKYHESLLLDDAGKKNTNIYAIYATSTWLGDYPLSAAAQNQINNQLQTSWNDVDKQGLSAQALLITSTLRYTRPGTELNLKARKQLESISQLAITDAQNGMRWKDIADNEDLNFSAEETMALLAEAFNESGDYKNVQPGIVKWLLTARQDEHWQTTKATAAAIDLLQKEKGTVFGQNKEFSADLAGQKLAVSDDLLNGTPTIFVPLKQQPQQVNLQQTGTASSGAITWYYFTSTDKLDTLNKAIKLKKQFFKYEEGKGWQPFTAGTVLQAGDKVKVKLTVDASIRLTFVHISDPRAAAFEPKDNSSGYQYNDGFRYYQSVRDTGLELFAEAIPKGISEINYELVVAHNGEFTSGPAQLQGMYKPGITAYSNATKIHVE